MDGSCRRGAGVEASVGECHVVALAVGERRPPRPCGSGTRRRDPVSSGREGGRPHEQRDARRRSAGPGPPAIRQHASPARVEQGHQAVSAARIDPAGCCLRSPALAKQQDRHSGGRGFSVAGDRRLHGCLLADRRVDPATAAGERSRVADLHRAARARGHPGWSQLQLPALCRDARCEPVRTSGSLA